MTDTKYKYYDEAKKKMVITTDAKKVKASELMRSVGNKDEDNNEIFEGDVMFLEFAGQDLPHKVVFKQDDPNGFYLEPIDTKVIKTKFVKTDNKLKVVGNIKQG